jgi:hypothetical protein
MPNSRPAIPAKPHEKVVHTAYPDPIQFVFVDPSPKQKKDAPVNRAQSDSAAAQVINTAIVLRNPVHICQDPGLYPSNVGVRHTSQRSSLTCAIRHVPSQGYLTCDVSGIDFSILYATDLCSLASDLPLNGGAAYFVLDCCIVKTPFPRRKLLCNHFDTHQLVRQKAPWTATELMHDFPTMDDPSIQSVVAIVHVGPDESISHWVTVSNVHVRAVYETSLN